MYVISSLLDFERVLEMEPGNKLAKSGLVGIQQVRHCTYCWWLALTSSHVHVRQLGQARTQGGFRGFRKPPSDV